MDMHALIKAAVEQNAAANFAPIWTLFSILIICLAWTVVPRLMRGSIFRQLCVLAGSTLVCIGILKGVNLMEAGFKQDAASVVRAVCSAVDCPQEATLTYRTATDAVDLKAAGFAPGPTNLTANLPMGLVHRIDQVLSGQSRPFSRPLAPTPLEFRLRPALEIWYVLPVRRFFWFAMVVCGAFCVFVFRKVKEGKGDWTLPYLASFCLVLVAHHLFSHKLDVEYRSAAACEPIAAALAKAYANPTAASFLEMRGPGPDGRRLTVKATAPRAFLGRTGEMEVVATLPEPLIRQLDAAAASLGYAPLNSQRGPTAK